ncbi:unnamed protein product [Closterium sp. NIES-54]
MFITLYFIVTRLSNSLRSVKDHFLSLDPTSLTVDLLEQHLLAAETSAIAVGAARGTPRPPFFEWCSPSPLAPSYASAAAADVSVAEDVGAASTSAKRRSSKGKGGRGGGGGSGGGGGGSGGGGGGSRSGGGGSSGGGGGSGGSGGSGGGGTGGGRTGPRRGGPGGGQRQQQQRRSKTYDTCPYVIRTGDRAGQTCGKLHTQHRYFSRLDDAWRAEFGNEVERPHWADLRRSGVAIFDLDFNVILSSMYAFSASAEGDCYRCVPPDPGIAAAALGAGESSTLCVTAPVEALHTFTLDSGASRCFFRDSTTLTPLPTPVLVQLADPSGGPVVARSYTVLPCPAVPSSSLSGLHLPSFSTNLVSTAALQDVMLNTTTPKGQRVSIYTCTRTGRHLVMFTRRPGSSLYTLATEPPQVAACAQVSASCRVAPPCSCRLLLDQTLLWHHRLGHPSLPPLRGMHSHLLVTGLPRSLPPLPPSPALPCLPCIKGRQRAAPHSSSFPPATAPLQTLRMDVWDPARVSGQGRECYFLLVVDDYTRPSPALRAFSSDLLREFCHGEGILQTFTSLDSPQQNGIAERRIGLVMEVACTSMIHAAAPHFLWPFAVRYAAHQLNLWPRVSLPETSPTLRWTREVGDVSVLRVLGFHVFVRDTSADKLSARAIPCVFLGFVPDAPGWQFYHPTSRCVFPSHDVTFDESVPFYCLFPYRSSPPPSPPLFIAPSPPPVDPLPPQGQAPSAVSHVDPLPGTAPVEVAVGSGAARGAASGGDASGGAEPGGAESEGAGFWGAEPQGAEPAGVEPRGVVPEGVEPGGDESEGAESRGAEPRGAASSGGSDGASPRLSPQQLREWLVRRARLQTRATGARGAGVTTGAGGTGGTAATSPRGAHTGGTGAAGTGGVGDARAGDPTEPGAAGLGGSGAGAGVVDPRAGGAGGTVRPRLYFVPLLQQVLGVPSSTSLAPPVLCPPPDQSQPPLLSASPLPAPSPYIEQSGGLTERREPASRPVSPACTARRIPRSRPPPVPGTHTMALQSESARPTSVGGECALGTDVLEDREEDFECLAAAVPRFASMLLAPEGDPDAPDIPTSRSYAEAITGPYSSQWQEAMDAEMASWKSTGTFVYDVLPPGANIVDGMWIFRVKRPPSSPPAFKVLQPFGFQFSSPQPTPLSTSHLLSAPPSDESVEPSALYPELVGCLMYLMTCTRPDLAYPLSLVARCVAPGRHRNVHLDAARRVLRYLCSMSGIWLVLGGRGPVVLTGHADASWVDDSATQRSSQGYTFSLGSGSVSWRSTRLSSALSSSCEAEIYGGAMAAQELRWLTYLLTDLGEQPHSPPVLYIDNKAMIALCQEHRLEHRTKHIALQYFLARELQQCGQFRLAYMATRANTTDIFSKALPPCDHQRFSTVLGLVPTLPHLLTA